jgi:hypothetical protein
VSDYDQDSVTFADLKQLLHWALPWLVTLAIGAVVLVALFAVAFFLHLLPIAAAIVLFFVSLIIMHAVDKFPWRHSRFVTSLLTVYFVDWVLFYAATYYAPKEFRHYVPAIIVVSVAAGYVAWILLGKKVVEVGPPTEDKRLESWFPLGAAIMIAAFILVSVVSPYMSHHFPSAWWPPSGSLPSNDSGGGP